MDLVISLHFCAIPVDFRQQTGDKQVHSECSIFWFFELLTSLGDMFRKGRITKLSVLHSGCQSRNLNDLADTLELSAFQFVKQV